MSPRSEAIGELQRQLKLVPDQVDVITKIQEFETAIRKGAPTTTEIRSMVLIAAGLLEYGLAIAIGSHFQLDDKLKVKIFDGDHEREGILGSLYTRSIIGRSLNIYGDKTLQDINSVRQIRNVCAHAKHDVDFSSDKLQPLATFHSVAVLDSMHGLTGIGALKPVSPAHGIMRFMELFEPYLLLHSSKEWLGSKNQTDWRAIFC